MVTSIRDPRSGTADIWLVDLEREIPTRFTSAPRTEVWMAWSPDGRRLAFAADWDGPPNIYVQEVPDGEARVLVPYDRRVQEPGSWSADGTLLLYKHDNDLQGDIWAVDVASGEREEILATEFGEVDPMLSPDGKILAYRSDVAGAFDIYLQSFPAGRNRTRLTVCGGRSVRWRDDGQELFYYDPARAYLMTVSVESTGPDRFVVGPAKPLFGIPRERFNGYDVLPGGQRFLVVLGEPGSGERPDHVVTDWTRLLDR